MPARKPLHQLVGAKSFVARKHRDRLSEDLLEQPDLRALQESYAAAETDAARCAIARAFEAAVRTSPGPGSEREALFAELDAIMHAPPAPFSP